MAAARALAPAFLRRAGMFSLVLALIAGIFGMHVINGHHNMHGPATPVTAASAGHTHHSHPDGEAARGVSPAAAHAFAFAGAHMSAGAHTFAGAHMSAAAGCPDGDCCGTQTMTVSCTPSGKTGTLAAPAPGTAVFAAAAVRAGPADPVTGRSAHRPDTPSPCALSISRT